MCGTLGAMWPVSVVAVKVEIHGHSNRSGLGETEGIAKLVLEDREGIFQASVSEFTIPSFMQVLMSKSPGNL
jgi:hypothetical protein